MQPSDGSFDLPSLSVAFQLSPVLSRRAFASSLGRADKFDPTLVKATAKRIAVSGFVVDQAIDSSPQRQAANRGHPKYRLGLPCNVAIALLQKRFFKIHSSIFACPVFSFSPRFSFSPFACPRFSSHPFFLPTPNSRDKTLSGKTLVIEYSRRINLLFGNSF